MLLAAREVEKGDIVRKVQSDAPGRFRKVARVKVGKELVFVYYEGDKVGESSDRLATYQLRGLK